MVGYDRPANRDELAHLTPHVMDRNGRRLLLRRTARSRTAR